MDFVQARVETLGNVIAQEVIEGTYSRKHIDAKIRKAIMDNPDMVAKLEQGVSLVNEWMHGTYYASKMARLEQLQALDIPELVMDIFTGVAYILKPELFTSVSAQLASRLGFNDTATAILTVAEVLAVLCQTDVFDITKEHRQSSLMVVSLIPLPDTLTKYMMLSQYLPPMVCEPLEVTHNFSSGYLTHNDTLILGSGNHHDGDICLDVINKVNKIPLKLCTQFLSTAEEECPNYTQEDMHMNAAKKGKTITEEKAYNQVLAAIAGWTEFRSQSYEFYLLMVQQGNRFYLTNRVCKRGRLYSQGYHISTQGNAFKKAMIEFAEEELVTGVP